jgi:hypothetical protein
MHGRLVADKALHQAFSRRAVTRSACLRSLTVDRSDDVANLAVRSCTEVGPSDEFDPERFECPRKHDVHFPKASHGQEELPRSLQLPIRSGGSATNPADAPPGADIVAGR